MTEHVTIADTLSAGLRAHASPDRTAQEKRYVNYSAVNDRACWLGSNGSVYAPDCPLRGGCHGSHLPAPGYAAHQGWDHDTVVGLAAELWSRPTHELHRGTVELLVACDRLLSAADLALVERFIRTAGTWAYVDDLAERVAGRVLLRQPTAAACEVDRWSRDEDFWIRRSALLALLPSLRAGSDAGMGLGMQMGVRERFTRYADRMVEEKEFFIRKAIGWVLREISKQDPAWTAEWVERRVGRLSGVTFREAVRRLEPGERDRLVALHRGGPAARQSR
jgi:3-methyladenine DNA glycosylase AlkD